MSPWMNTEDVATYLRYTGKHPLLSVYKFIKRHGIVVRRDGRRLLMDRKDVERALSLRKPSMSSSHTANSTATPQPFVNPVSR